MTEFFNPLGSGAELPDGMKQEMVQQQVDRLAYHSEMHKLLATAGQHTLWILDTMFGVIASAGEEAAGRAQFYQGLVDAHFQRSTPCYCGIDHLDNDRVGHLPAMLRDDIREGLRLRLSERDGRALAQHVAKTDEMLEYRLKPRTADPETGDDRPGLECMDCGYPYGTLEDRQVRPVGDCVGCHMKAAHG